MNDSYTGHYLKPLLERSPVADFALDGIVCGGTDKGGPGGSQAQGHLRHLPPRAKDSMALIADELARVNVVKATKPTKPVGHAAP